MFFSLFFLLLNDRRTFCIIVRKAEFCTFSYCFPTCRYLRDRTGTNRVYCIRQGLCLNMSLSQSIHPYNAASSCSLPMPAGITAQTIFTPHTPNSSCVICLPSPASSIIIIIVPRVRTKLTVTDPEHGIMEFPHILKSKVSHGIERVCGSMSLWEICTALVDLAGLYNSRQYLLAPFFERRPLFKNFRSITSFSIEFNYFSNV